MPAPDRDPLLEHAISRAHHAGRTDDTTGTGARHTQEDDHPAGRATWGSLTVRLRRDDHRTVSELRTVLGFDELPAAGDDPLLLLAHLLAGLATLLALLVQYLVAWALALRERHGPDYAADLTSPVV